MLLRPHPARGGRLLISPLVSSSSLPPSGGLQSRFLHTSGFHQLSRFSRSAIVDDNITPNSCKTQTRVFQLRHTPSGSALAPSRGNSTSSFPAPRVIRRPACDSQRPSLPRPFSHNNRRSFLTSLFPIPPSPFSPSSSTSLQTVTVTSILPHNVSDLFELIANISEYQSFVPYCAHSSVSHWSNPDPILGRRWPARAKLVVGWGGIQEEYVSRVYCLPGATGVPKLGPGPASASPHPSDTGSAGGNNGEWIVEAVAGKGETGLSKDLLSHYFYPDGTEVVLPDNGEYSTFDDHGKMRTTMTTTTTTTTSSNDNDDITTSSTVTASSSSSSPSPSRPPSPFPSRFPSLPTKSPASAVASAVFSHMVTRWTLVPATETNTKVLLTIKFAFSNPVYTLMSGPVLPKVSESMMGAFRRYADERARMGGRVVR